MADKKLNEVQKVTDMAYVPVIMSDGSIGQIAKADLASVVAEQMGFYGCEMKGIDIASIVYVLQIQTQFKGEVVGKYLLKDDNGNLSEKNFTASVNPTGSFSLGFDGGINPGSYVLVMCGGNK